ncbi:hypothetical protein AHAS_Ahas18G0190100 [Arachis hypogaea]
MLKLLISKTTIEPLNRPRIESNSKSRTRLCLSASLTLSPRAPFIELFVVRLATAYYRRCRNFEQPPHAPSLPLHHAAAIATFLPFHRAATVRTWKPPSHRFPLLLLLFIQIQVHSPSPPKYKP